MGQTGDDLCPITAMLQYLEQRGIDHNALFWLEPGRPLTQTKFVELLKESLHRAGIDPTHFSGHCFRIGTSTTAVANGVGDSTIQVMGRWRSACYQRYVRPSQAELAQVSHKISKGDTPSDSHSTNG